MVQKRPTRKNLNIQLGPFKQSESETTYQLNPGKNTAKSSSHSPTNSIVYLDEHFKVANSEDAHSHSHSKSTFKREITVNTINESRLIKSISHYKANFIMTRKINSKHN